MPRDIIIPDDPPAACRALFPFLNSCVYLDTGSSGVSFKGLGAAAAEFYDDAKSSGYCGRDAWQAKAVGVRARLSSMLLVATDEIEFFSGTTDALNMVGYSMQWQPGDEVVFAADEFPSVRLAWQGAERAGAVLRPVQIPDEAHRTETLANAITPRTRLLVTSNVHSATGTRIDLDRLGKACHAQGALFVVDGIHALGAVPISLAHVDVFMAGVFKWMLAGFGLSVCVIRRNAKEQMRPAFRGYLNEADGSGLQFAHVNYPGLYGLDASLKLLGEEFGWKEVQTRTEALVGWLADDLRAEGIEIAAPEDARSGLASIPVANAELAKARLAEQGIFVAPKHNANLGDLLRATPYFYNSRDDVARFVTAVVRTCEPVRDAT